MSNCVIVDAVLAERLSKFAAITVAIKMSVWHNQNEISELDQAARVKSMLTSLAEMQNKCGYRENIARSAIIPGGGFCDVGIRRFGGS
jgi:hypothetical protein